MATDVGEDEAIPLELAAAVPDPPTGVVTPPVLVEFSLLWVRGIKLAFILLCI